TGTTTAAPAPPPPPTAAPAVIVDTRVGRSKRIAGIAVAGGGVAAVGVGIAMSLLARQASDQLTHGTPGSTYDLGLDRQGRTDDTVAIAMYAVGGAAVVTGVVLYVLGRRDAQRARSFAI